jgi:hypothetical protein
VNVSEEEEEVSFVFQLNTQHTPCLRRRRRRRRRRIYSYSMIL